MVAEGCRSTALRCHENARPASAGRAFSRSRDSGGRRAGRRRDARIALDRRDHCWTMAGVPPTSPTTAAGVNVLSFRIAVRS